MKLKEDYILYNATKEETVAVATGESADIFSGLLRANNTAAAILNLLQEETSEEELVKQMLERYDASEEQIRSGVRNVLEILRKVGALEE